jgi:hypothetical protein
VVVPPLRIVLLHVPSDFVPVKPIIFQELLLEQQQMGK